MNAPERGEIVVRADQAALAEEAARAFVTLANTAIAEHGRFRVALSGGSTPRALHQRLAGQYHRAIEWERVEIFWGDERFVPPDDPESSFLMARETLLAHVPIPAAHIFPYATVGGTPEAAAHAYAETLKARFGDELPRFDLILLGIGPDGHTASLFPGHPEVVAPSDALVVAVHDAPKPPPDRLTFTLRLINAAANVIVLVGGADKAATLRDVLRGAHDIARLPAQGVRPERGTLTWLVDAAAAQQLGD
ncbi:MAG TPA: 6-phosphogluconolactonase [Roseiflexaceae bacterium]|nr:6-phosphogluconolactonase [Roseiflexaceae bacterium]